MRTDELLYRLREIMPELGENEVADEMYKIVFEYAEQEIEEYEITEVCPHCENEITINADRIRAMSDEELAMQILENFHMHDWPDSVRKIYFSYDRPSKDNPKKAWLEWLQQPAEGEEDKNEVT